MRAVVQRVSRAVVRVDEETISWIGRGLLVLVSVGADDADADALWMADKVRTLRIFPDDEGAMNRSIEEIGGAVLAVSQFTLHADARRGRRPSFIAAARPEEADRLYSAFCAALRDAGVDTAAGVFRAHMEVELVNDGPVTILLDSKKSF